MIVADLIRLLEACDPNALVLIPRDGRLDDPTDVLVDAIPIAASAFNTGPAATHGAVRLAGITTATVFIATGLAANRVG